LIDEISPMRPAFRTAFLLTCVIPFAPRIGLPKPDPRCLPDAAADTRQTSSNVLPEDYVGPAACANCHRRKHELWSGHPHSRMNQLPGPVSVLGDFAGRVLRLPQGSVTFSSEGGVYRMTLERGDTRLRSYEVTRTVGTRTMQFYIGVQSEGPEPANSPVYREHMLPFAWWVSLGRWLPKHYFDADGPEAVVDGVPVVEGIDHITDVRPYNAVCMNCHNTFSYAYRIFDPMFAGFPDATVAAVVGPLSARISETVPVRPSAQSFGDLNSKLDPDRHLVTLGISCESCHFGCREHATEGKPVHFLPTSPYVRVTPRDPERPLTDSRKDPATINGICAQCHSGNTRFFPNCAAQANSREALDFTRGACASQLRCVSCHEPHTAGPPSGGPDRPEHIDLCVTCHDAYRDPGRAVAHGGHPAGTSVSCLDCHMPRYTLGLDDVVRTHRIAAPVEQSMVTAASANACNLCHLDRSLRWTVEALERSWGRPLSLPQGGSIDVDRPLGEVWLTGTDPALRLVAGQSYARSRAGEAKLPDLLRALNDPEPINRVFALKAVERARNRKLDARAYQLTAPAAERARQIDRLLADVPPAVPESRH
jgi:predicted CXXCH cytochrome family protein